VTLPSYRKPPVAEVIVAVAFRPLERLSVVHIADLWRESFASHFKRVEEQPPHIPQIEQVGVQAFPPQISMLVSQQPLPTRLWFLTDDGQELLQVQRDWFACNWRKVTPESEYGRWPSRRAAFEKWFGELQRFIAAQDLGRVEPTQCEVTYINPIPLAELGEDRPSLSPLLQVVQDVPSEFLKTPEQMQLAVRYLITDDDGVPVGRLHVEAQPAIGRQDNRPLVILNLTARGRPEGDGGEGALKFLDRGREWVVRAFSELTTAEMQRRWQRYE
jgi:uncharacterized protein (TIGR04255 family)